MNKVIKMENIIRKYTDEKYLNKIEISNKMSAMLVESTWQQISDYRSTFFYEVKLVQHQKFCLCKGISYKILKMRELISQLNYYDNYNLANTELFIAKYNNSEKLRYMLKRWQNSEILLKEMIHELCIEFDYSLENNIIEVLLDDNIIDEFKWVNIFYSFKDRFIFAYLIFCALCISKGNAIILSFFDLSYFNTVFGEDGTYALQYFVQHLHRDASKAILKYRSIENSKKDFHQIIFKYPQLRPYQIEFYLNHRTSGYFYTIEMFITNTKVCYETARNSLDMLVQLGFYDKIKTGKKYIYSIK